MDNLSLTIVDQSNDLLPDDCSLAGIIDLALESQSEIQELSKTVTSLIPDKESPPLAWLTTYQAKVLLNISESTLKRLRQRKLINYIKVNGYCRYPYPELLKIIESRMKLK